MTQSSQALRNVRVDLGARSYNILVGAGARYELSTRLSAMLKRPRVFVLTDETVMSLHGNDFADLLKTAGIGVDIRPVPAGEATKSLGQLDSVLDWLLEAGADRSDVLVALGGGVIGDLAGLAASLMKRGMGLVQVPTTLLSQVDSSVGGKTAINSARGKNLIGAFYQPRLVIADPHYLSTLPDRELKAGFAEVVKYGLINDAPFFEWLKHNGQNVLGLEPDAIAEAVARSCQAKADIVAQDEREGGVRALLNLGHTFGHALETVNGYGSDLLHGEAVACGMALAFRYGARHGIASTDDAAAAAALLSQSGLPVSFADVGGGPYGASALVEAMKQDKKARAGRVPLILARGIGKAYIHPDADLSDVETFLNEELDRS